LDFQGGVDTDQPQIILLVWVQLEVEEGVEESVNRQALGEEEMEESEYIILYQEFQVDIQVVAVVRLILVLITDSQQKVEVIHRYIQLRYQVQRIQVVVVVVDLMADVLELQEVQAS
jgi:hypothetical protein